MITLAFVSRWFFSGGWRIVGISFAAIVAGILLSRVRHWQVEADRVPLLTAHIADSEKRAQQILNRFAEAEQKRGAAEAALSAWQSYKTVTLDIVKETGRNASASLNSACAPSADDRRLRNTAIRQLFGPDEAGTDERVPAAARAPD